MKVLLVGPSHRPFLGGAQTLREAMARRLVADGHQVTLLTTNVRQPSDFWQPPKGGLSPLPAVERVEGLVIERLPLTYPWPAPYAFGVLRRAGHWLGRLGLPTSLARPLQWRLSSAMPPLPGLSAALDRLVPSADLVQVEDASWDGLFAAAARAALRDGKPLVALPLMHLSSAGISAQYQMAHQVDIYRKASAVLVISAREGDTLAQLGVAPERIHRLTLGIDSPVVSPQGLDIAAFRRKYGLNSPFVAFLGANTYDKGAYTLALAVAHLNRAGARVGLVCAGPQSDGLRAFMERQPPEVRDALRKQVHILGVVDERCKQQLLSAMDVLALPSQVDAFGLVFLEAWLHSKPVIGARAGGIPDLVVHEETGLLVPFADVAALAMAIRRLLADSALALRLGSAGHREVLERYTWEHTYRQLLEVYSSSQ